LNPALRTLDSFRRGPPPGIANAATKVAPSAEALPKSQIKAVLRENPRVSNVLVSLMAAQPRPEGFIVS
jgi:hypothetical protein